MKWNEECPVRHVRGASPEAQSSPPSDAGSLTNAPASKIPQLPRRMEEEEFQEADVLWPWPDTPPPSSSSEGSYGYDYHYDLPAATPELYDEYDAAAAVAFFSCEPFSSEPAAASSWSASSTSSTLSAALLSSDWSDDDGGGFFLSGASTVSAAGLGLGAAEESFLEADVLWPDTADDDAAEFFWRRRSCRIEEAAASAAAAVFCGKREEGCGRPLVMASSPIDIPMATRGAAAAARRRRP